MFTNAEPGHASLNRLRDPEGREPMPQIIVTADQVSDRQEPPVLFRERVNPSDFESEHFATQLVERLGWAVSDADEVDRESAKRN